MGDPGKDREALIEDAAAAFRGRDAHGKVLAHRAFADLDEAGRLSAFALAARLRAMEAALDPDGLSSTSRAVLARILSR